MHVRLKRYMLNITVSNVVQIPLIQFVYEHGKGHQGYHVVFERDVENMLSVSFPSDFDVTLHHNEQ